MAAPHYDVFLSYHPSDGPWARGLVTLLKWLKLEVFTHEAIQVGHSIVGTRSQALEASRFFIQIVSPEAMVGTWEEIERNAFLMKALEAKEPSRILPVMLKPASLPGLFADHNACKLVGMSGEMYRAELSRLVRRLSDRKDPEYVLPEGAPVPDALDPNPLDKLWLELVNLYAGELRRPRIREHFAGQMKVPNASAMLASLASHGGQRGAELVATRYLLSLSDGQLTPRLCLDDLTANKEDLAAGDASLYQRLHRELELLVNPPEPIHAPKPPTGGKSTDDPLASLPHYLTATLSEHAQIPLIGVNPELKLTLGIDDVYVPLRADMRRGIYHEEKWHAKNPAAHSEDRGMESTDIDLAQAFACAGGKRGVVILGDPGSGKTTLLKLLLVRCIRKGGESLGLPRDIVPVMLPLRDLKGDKNLDAFFQRSLSENPHLTLPPEFARALRESRPLLYLLDGLDEVANEAERVRVSHWIQGALKTHTSAYFALTCRYAGYQGNARLDDHFAELNVRPLREPEANALVENFYRIVETAQLGDNNRAQVSAKVKSAHLQTLLASDQHRTRRMRELQSNPLLLTILCLVHQRFNTLPDERWRLYELCLDTLLYHWQKAKHLKLPFEKLETARRLLLPLAHWLHQVDKRRHATADDVVTALAEPLFQLSVTPDAMRQFLVDVRDRSGLLVGWGTDSYGFIHLALQEYLTATELKNRSHGHLEVLDEAALHFGESWWTEVILLLVSLPEPSMFEPFMRRVVLQDTFAQLEHRALLADCVADASVKSPLPFLEVVTNPDRTDDTKLAALWALRGMNEEQKARVIEVCRTLVDSSNPQLRAQARELLEARGEMVATRPPLKLEAGTIWVHRATGLEFVYVPAGSFEMGGKRYFSERPIHTVTFKRGYWIGKYPVTNAQYGRFLAANKNHREPRTWKDSQVNGAEQPVVDATWEDAIAYCKWAHETLMAGEELPPADGEMIVLPSEAEWEYAARGPESREYPWGNTEPTHELANFARKVGRTSPVGRYPKGASWVGALDMAGNVWEWCSDPWHENYQGAPKDGKPWVKNPTVPRRYLEERNPQNIRVLRGGSWDNDARCWDDAMDDVRSAYRDWGHIRGGYPAAGFRVLAAALPARDTGAVDT